MFSYEKGWMHIWQPDGEERVRFSPVPQYQKWLPTEKHWIDLEPGTLWISKAEYFERQQRRQKKLDKPQMLLPGIKCDNERSAPPRPTAGLPASWIWSEVPKTWRQMLKSVPVHPWRGLLFLSHFGSEGEDLFYSNPGLAWLLFSRYLAGDVKEIEKGKQVLQEGLKRRQRDLLDLLDLPRLPWLVKMIRKLECDEEPAYSLYRLDCLLGDGRLRRIFQHLPRLPSRVMRMVHAETMDLLTGEFIHEMESMENEAHQLDDIEENLFDAAIIAQRGEKVPKFRSSVELEQWGWLRAAKCGDAGTRSNKKGQFPSPPLPGTPTIIPILTPELLKEESRRMHHCVATYEREVWQKKVAIYAVFRPERATVGLRQNPDGTWRVFDFRCTCNRLPEKETRAEVAAWLGCHGIAPV